MRALISVFDKTGLPQLANFFKEEGIEMISTGGTYTYLTQLGYAVTKVEEVTGAKELLKGRVKTLHPRIHGGLLYRRGVQEDEAEMLLEGIEAIDFVCVNLYPFTEELKNNHSLSEQVEFIDIGGPTMLRAAAKNFAHVYTLCHQRDYEPFMTLYRTGSEEAQFAFRKTLAGHVFNLMGAYDSTIASYLLQEEEHRYLSSPYEKVTTLRYGENPHQKASLYRALDGQGALSSLEMLGGKELSYNNYKDLDIAWKVVQEFHEPCCCALKHNTPCGVALGKDDLEAYEKAYEADPVSIFGGVVALNCEVTLATAEAMAKIFLEVVMAPSYTKEALALLKEKKNLRILQCTRPPQRPTSMVSLDGLLLLQEEDRDLLSTRQVVTKIAPSEEDLEELLFAWKVVKYVKSNAIVVTSNKQTLGIGGGQVNRIDAATYALEKAQGRALYLASDAFFPFQDVVEAAAKEGIHAIIQPGGSLRDQASIDACDEQGLAMVFTSMRHFKH